MWNMPPPKFLSTRISHQCITRITLVLADSFGKRRHLQVILVFFFTGYAVFDKAASGKDNKVTLMKYT